MNKVMIITGGSRGIGAATADLCGAVLTEYNCRVEHLSG